MTTLKRCQNSQHLFGFALHHGQFSALADGSHSSALQWGNPATARPPESQPICLTSEEKAHKRTHLKTSNGGHFSTGRSTTKVRSSWLLALCWGSRGCREQNIQSRFMKRGESHWSHLTQVLFLWFDLTRYKDLHSVVISVAGDLALHSVVNVGENWFLFFWVIHITGVFQESKRCQWKEKCEMKRTCSRTVLYFQCCLFT